MCQSPFRNAYSTAIRRGKGTFSRDGGFFYLGVKYFSKKMAEDARGQAQGEELFQQQRVSERVRGTHFFLYYLPCMTGIHT